MGNCVKPAVEGFGCLLILIGIAVLLNAGRILNIIESVIGSR